ncbi:MAG: Crp/Fnr family transcriptional regulator [Chloroflexota bacterium]
MLNQIRLNERHGADLQQRVFGHIPLAQADFDRLFRSMRLKHYGRKAFLLRAIERWDRLFFIQTGLIRLFYANTEGKEFNKAFFGTGQCIWPVAPSDREQRVLFNVAALEKTAVLELPFAHLYETLQQVGLWEQFALPFAEGLVEQKFQREHDFLLLDATARFEKFARTYPHWVERIPDYHLASFLGMTNVSLSRIKKNAKILT